MYEELSVLEYLSKGRICEMWTVRNLRCCLGLLVLFATRGLSQESIRILDYERVCPNQPVQVTGRFVGDKPFSDEKSVVADPDWLKDLTLEVTNVSSKSIRAFNMTILVKRPGFVVVAGIPLDFRTYSKETDNNALALSGERKIGPLAPSETVKVKITDHNFMIMNEELKKRGFDDIKHAWLEIQTIYFEDGSRWSGRPCEDLKGN